MNLLEIDYLNPELTLLGGQAFNWFHISDYFYIGLFQDKAVLLKKVQDKFYWQTFPEKDNEDFINRYFNVNFKLEDFASTIQGDDFLKDKFKELKGLRLLNQDFDQTFISFITSQNSNIPKIKSTLNNLSKYFDRKIEINGDKYYLFPSTYDISDLKLGELYDLGFGYRSKYLLESSNKLQVFSPAKMSDDVVKQRKYLLDFYGIGEKVADCIMTFSLNDMENTPIDLWMKRIYIDIYKQSPKSSYSVIKEFFRNKFGMNTSWAGQYLFEGYRKK